MARRIANPLVAPTEVVFSHPLEVMNSASAVVAPIGYAKVGQPYEDDDVETVVGRLAADGRGGWRIAA
jgi:hypothetical protein